ncbi:MAG: nucleotidyl transferase AbiEii/AbiGii toxin family protein [Deltaproteobacteria bacterium]|nr:nucleotidyl transferase AbiEii/AbiGii toxin family protein [Deltaproteobacteria bacterium]
MHSEAISEPLWGLLKKIDENTDMRATYLGGGSGLAFQLGHRISEDLDFYVRRGFDSFALEEILQRNGFNILILNQTPRHTEWMVESIKVDWINEIIPLKFPLKTLSPDIKNIRVADPRDIGRMKILAISSRGSKKDYIDLYCITREIMTLESLISLAMEHDKGVKYSKLLFLKGLVDFEEADREENPSMILEISWEEVKDSLKQEVKRIAAEIR